MFCVSFFYNTLKSQKKIQEKIDGWNHQRADKKGTPKKKPKVTQPTGSNKKRRELV